MAILKDKKPKGWKKKKGKKVKPWMGNGIGRIRSLGKPMPSRASKGSR
jgi:hypothetical protein